ncbi:MAG: patatin-like phospholipase family protein [Propionibacteriaceae bacterium]|jgi:NTE family protein|nr:patatin-like phospholipase family protein [Propionibacteriaceae bacterium]
MTTPGLGLALGGGAVLGAAHLGALRVLEERGLQPEFVAGTSAGALVGAAYAAGLSLDAIDALMREGRWHDVGRLTLSPRLGVLDPRPLDETVAARVGVALIEDLPVAFGAVTTDLLTRQEVVLTRGSLARALRASIAIPGLFPPVVDEGRILIDGGMVANLPIAAVRALGATRVIAVRVRPEWEYLPIAPTAERIARLEAEPGTIVVRPEVTGLSMWTTGDVPRLIEAGRRAAELALEAAEDLGVADEQVG